jgi:hypothetical protein
MKIRKANNGFIINYGGLIKSEYTIASSPNEFGSMINDLFKRFRQEEDMEDDNL